MPPRRSRTNQDERLERLMEKQTGGRSAHSTLHILRDWLEHITTHLVRTGGYTMQGGKWTISMNPDDDIHIQIAQIRRAHLLESLVSEIRDVSQAMESIVVEGGPIMALFRTLDVERERWAWLAVLKGGSMDGWMVQRLTVRIWKRNGVDCVLHRTVFEMAVEGSMRLGVLSMRYEEGEEGVESKEGEETGDGEQISLAWDRFGWAVISLGVKYTAGEVLGALKY